jgi:hypothetical protein
MSDPAQRIVIVDLRIPFVRLVLFFVKAALAAIPAAIIFGILLMLATALVAALAGNGGFFIMRQWTFSAATVNLSVDIPSAVAVPPTRGEVRRRAKPASW